MSAQTKVRNVTVATLQRMKQEGEKFACLTAYDACFAGILCDAGVEVILIGDSLGMVLQGHDSTLPVTMDDMIYHTECVKRGNKNALLIADLPFMSYSSEVQTLENAASLMRAGGHMVKLEGGAWIANTTRLLAERGIPVCAHMGLTPQSINRIGGFSYRAEILIRHRPSSMKPNNCRMPGPVCCCWNAYPARLPKRSPRPSRSLSLA